MANVTRDEDVTVVAGGLRLPGHLTVPDGATGIVIFVHGSGSSRNSPRNRYVASVLQEAGLGTLLFDLLTPEEETDRGNVFDIGLLAGRLTDATAWLREQGGGREAGIGWFGASTGAGAALWAAAEPSADVAAIVSRGGRPDLAGDRLEAVRAPTLLIVGGLDTAVLGLNEQARSRLRGIAELVVVPGATHLFEEPGTLEQAAAHARDWFRQHLHRNPGNGNPGSGFAGGEEESGFQLLPHTADVMVSAWAPTVDGCLAQAVRGLVASFADVGDRTPQRLVGFTCDPGPEPEVLLELLDEVIYVLDAQDVVPVQVAVARTGEGGLVGELGVVDRSTVEIVGPAPKAVTRHDLSFHRDDGTWRCRAVVDV